MSTKYIVAAVAAVVCCLSVVFFTNDRAHIRKRTPYNMNQKVRAEALSSNSLSLKRRTTRIPAPVIAATFSSDIMEEFDDDPGLFASCTDHTLESIRRSKADAPYIACAPYVGSGKVAHNLREAFGSKAVTNVSANREMGWACFIVHANIAGGERLIADGGTDLGVTNADPLPAELKFARGTLDHAIKGDEALGLVIHMAPGAASIPSEQSAAAHAHRWLSGLGTTSEDDNGNGFRKLSFWSSDTYTKHIENRKLKAKTENTKENIDENLHESADPEEKSTGKKDENLEEDKSAVLTLTESWNNALDRVESLGTQAHRQCGWSSVTVKHNRGDVLHIEDLGGMLMSDLRGGASDDHWAGCFAGLLTYLSSQHDIAHIMTTKVYKTFNYFATQIMQGGTVPGDRPLWQAGLNGTGEIVGVIDSGLDDASCFFKDPDRGQVPRSTLQALYTDMQQRKVVQYVISGGDSVDVYAGHGTHVSTSIAGSIYTNWTQKACPTGTTQDCWGACLTDSECANYEFCAGYLASGAKISTCKQATLLTSSTPAWDFVCPAYGCLSRNYCYEDAKTSVESSVGHAPEAKIAFVDAGIGDQIALSYYGTIGSVFDASRSQGAGIHSNSWGGCEDCTATCFMDDFRYQVDAYVFDNPYQLIIFAAGNSGALGSCTISTPANGKNSMAVGCTTSAWDRGGEFDNEVRSGGAKTVASFSSQGPTYDKRIKPDIVAPGFYVLSGMASTSDVATDETCATTMSHGTSMSAPAVAGEAALVRQYFRQGLYQTDLINGGLCTSASSPYMCNRAFIPTAALMKAVIIAAGEATSTTPNLYKEGHGLIKLNKVLPLGNPAIKLFTYEGTIAQNTSQAFTMVLDADSWGWEVQAVLTWMDPATSVVSLLPVLHDLDLLVFTPGTECSTSRVKYANRANGVTSSENVEKTIFNADASGGAEYTVYVQSNELVAKDTQDFSLVIVGPVNVTVAGVADPSFSLVGCQGGLLPNITEVVTPVSGCYFPDNYPACCLTSSQLAKNVGDGVCDDMIPNNGLNVETCGWDGGDCCPWTCDASTNLCGYVGYNCMDPNYTQCEAKVGSTATSILFVGDGYCDPLLNIPECQYDGNDCCEACCHPVLSSNIKSARRYDCGYGGYSCLDTNCSALQLQDSSAAPAGGQRTFHRTFFGMFFVPVLVLCLLIGSSAILFNHI